MIVFDSSKCNTPTKAGTDSMNTTVSVLQMKEKKTNFWPPTESKSHPHKCVFNSITQKNKQLGTGQDKDRSSDLHLSPLLGNKQREIALHLSCCHPTPVSHSQARHVHTDRVEIKCVFLLLLCSADRSGL